MLNHKMILVSLFCFPSFAFADGNATLGSITAQRSILEDLSLQVQIQEQSQKLNQLLMPAVPPPQPGELTAKQLLDKLEVPEENGKTETGEDEDGRSSKVIAVYTNNKVLKAKVKYKGKPAILTDGQTWNGQKVRIFRDRVVIGNNTLEL